jgi:hypothetical protein
MNEQNNVRDTCYYVLAQALCYMVSAEEAANKSVLDSTMITTAVNGTPACYVAAQNSNSSKLAVSVLQDGQQQLAATVPTLAADTCSAAASRDPTPQGQQASCTYLAVSVVQGAKQDVNQWPTSGSLCVRSSCFTPSRSARVNSTPMW